MGTIKPIIKVKDTRFIMIIIIGFCIFPIVFLLIANIFEQNYILAIILTLAIYTVFCVLYLKKLKRDEDNYAIIATEFSVTILKHGTLQWNEISSIEHYYKRAFGMGSPNKYIKFSFFNGDVIELDATSYDIEYKELTNQLNKIRTNRQ